MIDVMINIINSNEFQTFIKLILVALLSGIIGFERENWSKPAGFRTHVLVGISAAMVMICGEYIIKLVQMQLEYQLSFYQE